MITKHVYKMINHRFSFLLIISCVIYQVDISLSFFIMFVFTLKVF